MNRTLGILVASGTEYPNTTANSVQQLKTAHALARAGADVVFYGKDIAQNGLSSAQILDYYGLAPHERLRLEMIPTTPGRYRDRVFIGKLLPTVGASIMRQQVDACLARSPQIFAAVWPLLKLGGVVSLFEAHDMADEELSYRGISRRTRTLHRWALRHADGIVTVTKSAKRAMYAQGISSERILVAPDAADPLPYSPPRPRLDDGIVRVGYVGSLYMDRGCATLIHALLHVIETLPQGMSVCCVVIGGQPSQVTDLRRLAERLELREQVTFTGHLPHHEIPTRLGAFDVLVNPLEQTLVGEKYASPMKLFEYMAAMRPIVASDLPTIREIVDERCVTFFKPGDAWSLGQSIVQTAVEWPHSVVKAERAYARFLKYYTFDARAQQIMTSIARLAP